MPTIGDFTSSSFALGASTLADPSSSDERGTPSDGVSRLFVTGWGRIAGSGTAGVTMAPRCCGVLEMRSFMPLSVEISIESTDDPSSSSTIFFT